MARNLNTFKYSLVSDLHLDFPQQSTRSMDWQEHIVVAGDTTNGLAGIAWLQKKQKAGHKIFAVDGNHEHYANRTKSGNMQRTQAETEAQFYALLNQPQSVEVAPGLTMVGVNGWYDPYLYDGMAEAWATIMNDYRWIGAIEGLAEKHYQQLDSMIREAEGKVIVVTHTAPTLHTLIDKPWDPRWQESNNWYHNRFMYKAIVDHKDKIAVWNHGHTHRGQDKDVMGVRVVCNPRGYPGENPRWTPVDIEVEY